MKFNRLVLILLLVVGCEENEILTEGTPQIEFILKTRLEMDENGLYHLEVNRNTFQTLHRLSGNIYEDGEPMDVVKFGWTSSHYFQLGDTLGYFIHRGLTDDLVYVSYDTTYITGFSDFIVPTINCCSYSNSDGEVNSMIGVIKKMVDDTLTISVSYYHPYTSELRTQTFQVVLD